VSGTEIPFEGVKALDHTADVGLEVRAGSLVELLRRSAAGMTHLILEGSPPDGEEECVVSVVGADPPQLLRNWLRELLYLHEAEGFAYSAAEFTTLDAGVLEAVVRGGADPSEPAREIKGVTLHGLVTERTPEGEWYARVIFDV